MPSAAYLTHTHGACADFPSIRKILVNWLVEVIEDDGMKSETLFLAVNYLDRYLSKRPVPQDELQLVAITAILVASKHEELAPQSVQNLQNLVKSASHADSVQNLQNLVKPASQADSVQNLQNLVKSASHADVLNMEAQLLHTLDYSLT
ncbi:cyclin [Baffinella frigidus]|nr:cyclin [Cryptophyta sp. CCMP2293]